MNLRDTIELNAYGTSEGSERGWDTRGRGRKEAGKEDKKWANSKPKFKFTSEEIARVQKLAERFKREEDPGPASRDEEDEDEISRESFKDQHSANKSLISAMKKGSLQDAYYHGKYAGDAENFPEHTNRVENVLDRAAKRDPGSWNRMAAVYEKYGD